MVLRLFIASILIPVILSAQGYELGKGYKIADFLTLGSYFTSNYQSSSANATLGIDDIAILAYGNINNRFSYMSEFESTQSYIVDLQNSATMISNEMHIERLYLDYKSSDALNFRLGKQITPIGYWAAQPISVLRDTTSNPVISTMMYPRIFTGLDIYGYFPFSEATKYHLLLQNNQPFDEAYSQIATDHFFALALDSEITMNWSIGGSIGHFFTLDDEDHLFAQLNSNINYQSFTLSAEIILNATKYTTQSDYTKLGAYYVQLLYRQSAQHSFITRFEHANDKQSIMEESFLVFGYSFRPLYPISLKGEYQWHNNPNLNLALLSFSVLF